MIKVGVSNHHVHLTREACDVLFGKGYELTVKRPLLQKGQYAANETVDVIKNDKVLEIYGTLDEAKEIYDDIINLQNYELNKYFV